MQEKKSADLNKLEVTRLLLNLGERSLKQKTHHLAAGGKPHAKRRNPSARRPVRERIA